jgi:hypothetical protein
MNAFDKVCAAVAFLLGVLLLMLGIVGLFAGSRASFTLPPILGGIPSLIGWGIIRSVMVAWKCPRRHEYPESLLSTEDETTP